MVDVLSKVSPEMMSHDPEEDMEISKTMHYVKSEKSHLWPKSEK